MSISTKRGDDGDTDLMFGRRVAKSDQRVASYGAVDELNTALGLARVAGESPPKGVPEVQAELVKLMGELATHPDDLARYLESGFTQVSAEMVDRLGAEVARIETEDGVSLKGWAVPGDGGSVTAAFLDQARTICRRAEREVAILSPENDEILRYLNRLSDLLWLLARAVGESDS